MQPLNKTKKYFGMKCEILKIEIYYGEFIMRDSVTYMYNLCHK